MINVPTNGDVPAQKPTHRELERTKSVETPHVKSEPMDTDDHKKYRPIQPAASQPTTPVASSTATKSFLISPPNSAHAHHKIKNPPSLPIPPAPALPPPLSSTSHFSAMNPNSNTNFAPRISSTATAQKNNGPATLHMTSSARQPPSTAHKRPGPPVYPSTAPRTNAVNPAALRMASSTSLQPQSFDAFSINPPVQRRPNGMALPSSTPPLSTRNPVRVSRFSSFVFVSHHRSVRSHPDASLQHSSGSTSAGRVSLRVVTPAGCTPCSSSSHQTPAEVQTIIKSFNDKVNLESRFHPRAHTIRLVPTITGGLHRQDRIGSRRQSSEIRKGARRNASIVSCVHE